MTTAVNKNKAVLHKQVTCPFCSLLCDDLSVKVNGQQLSVIKNQCPKALQGFEQPLHAQRPQINGKPVNLDKAIKQSAILIKRAKQPLISGMGTDAAGSRAAMLLAEKSGAIIDHQAGDAIIRNMLVVQTGGWIMTTLAELKNRADFILFLGTDTRKVYPRFFERFIYNKNSLFIKKISPDNVALIGDSLKVDNPAGTNQLNPTSIKCANEKLGDYVSALLGMVREKNITSRNLPSSHLSKLKAIGEKVRNSKYSAIVWSPAAMDFAHAELTIQTICELIRELNRTTRAAGLSLGGDNGAGTLTNICTWQSGYPLRVSYANKHPVYDPYNFSTRKLLESAGTDLLLWISSFHSEINMPENDIPKIILARPSRNPAPAAHVYIPVATPGIDHDGNLFRTDNVVSLPLKKLRASSLPGVTDVITRIIQEL